MKNQKMNLTLASLGLLTLTFILLYKQRASQTLKELLEDSWKKGIRVIHLEVSSDSCIQFVKHGVLKTIHLPEAEAIHMFNEVIEGLEIQHRENPTAGMLPEVLIGAQVKARFKLVTETHRKYVLIQLFELKG